MTHDHQLNGIKYRYCAVCDHSYVAGTFDEHRQSYPHRASMSDRRAMAKWYKANGV